MSVQPITDNKKKLEWSKRSNTSQPRNEAENRLASTLTFVSDFVSPVDQIPQADHSLRRTQVEEKKKRPLRYTSENWIG
ncbi:MAG: hypothetical protein M1495_06695 [Bacteroidetes bacterium]|nr:hypothetical protein [Bacteroidota bacterium]MCL6098842.1 hypothetical protein [Bacteroidota bacterium]